MQINIYTSSQYIVPIDFNTHASARCIPCIKICMAFEWLCDQLVIINEVKTLLAMHVVNVLTWNDSKNKKNNYSFFVCIVMHNKWYYTKKNV